MLGFDRLVDQIRAVPDADASIVKLLHEIAQMIDAIDFDDDGDEATAMSDELSDIAFGLRARAQAFADAILRKPLPDVIHLPGPESADHTGEQVG
jgi:hypothetical protein